MVEYFIVAHKNWGPSKFHQMLRNSFLRKSTL